MRANVEGLGNYEEDLLAKGTYECEIVKAEIAETRSGGHMLKLEALIQDGPETEQGESPIGQRLFPSLPHPDRSHKDGGTFAGIQLRKACEAAGVVYDDTGYDSEDFIGATVNVLVDHEEYEGEVRVRAKKLTAV